MVGIERRVLVVDDEPSIRALLVQALSASGFVVEAASDAIEAQAILPEFDPDLVLLDIALGDGPSGLDLGHALWRQRPDIALVFLTKQPDGGGVGAGLAGIPPGSGFLRKDRIQDFDYFIASIEAVLTGDHERARHGVDPASADGTDVDAAAALARLSAKHVEVLRLIALGCTNERIAVLKGVVPGTVERWTHEIFEGLGIPKAPDTNRRVEAVRRYIAAVGMPART